MGLGSGIRDPGSEIRDPGSGIWKKPIPDPGSRDQKGTGSRIWIRIRIRKELSLGFTAMTVGTWLDLPDVMQRPVAVGSAAWYGWGTAGRWSWTIFRKRMWQSRWHPMPPAFSASPIRIVDTRYLGSTLLGPAWYPVPYILNMLVE